MNLTEFLLARIAEDEAVARAAVGTAVFARQTGNWSFETVNDQYGPIPIVFAVTDTGAKTQVANLEGAWEREERGAHIARHDPACVLAECEAKRRIVALATELAEWDEMGSSTAEEGDAILAALALPYADHQDYQQEWSSLVAH
jgi:Family of unknown function (DUF6221)